MCGASSCSKLPGRRREKNETILFIIRLHAGVAQKVPSVYEKPRLIRILPIIPTGAGEYRVGFQLLTRILAPCAGATALQAGARPETVLRVYWRPFHDSDNSAVPHQVTTQVEISAPRDRVWAELMAWEGYPDWNPFIRHIGGSPSQGARLRVLVQLPHGRGVRLRPEVRRLAAPGDFAWAGRLWLPGMLQFEQRFRLEPLDGGCTLLVQTITFRGFLTGLMWRSLRRTARRSAMLMNAALKGKIERFGKELGKEGV